MRLPVEQPWYHDGLQFECTGCGNCCTGGPGYVWISDSEIERLAAFLKISPQEARKQYCRKLNGGVSLKEKRPNAKGEYDCVFLHEVPPEPGQTDAPSKRICAIYPVRPLQCRTFPFWKAHLTSRDTWDAVMDRCPAVNRGKRWTYEQIVQQRDAEDW